MNHDFFELFDIKFDWKWGILISYSRYMPNNMPQRPCRNFVFHFSRYNEDLRIVAKILVFYCKVFLTRIKDVHLDFFWKNNVHKSGGQQCAL